MFFSCLDRGYGFGGRRPQTWSTIFISLYPGHTLLPWLVPVDVDLDYLAQVVSVRFLYWEATPPHPIPCSHCTPWRKVTASFIFPLHFIDFSLHAWLCWGPRIWTYVRRKMRPLPRGQCSEDKGGPLTLVFPLLCFCALSEFSKCLPFLSTIKFKIFLKNEASLFPSHTHPVAPGCYYFLNICIAFFMLKAFFF